MKYEADAATISSAPDVDIQKTRGTAMGQNFITCSMLPSCCVKIASMSTIISEDVLNRIMSIVRTYPKGEGITVEALMDKHGFTDSSLVNAALNELQKRGELAAQPLFFYTGE